MDESFTESSPDGPSETSNARKIMIPNTPAAIAMLDVCADILARNASIEQLSSEDS